MCLIIIGSPIAFNIIIALGTVSGSIGDITVISCMIRRRLSGEPLLPSRFSLGKAGIFFNIGAVCYTSLAVVFLAFPTYPRPSLVDMNWASLMFGVLISFAIIYYFIFGRKNYKGPVEYVKKTM